ncbi:MAG: DnaD domain protein [Candidatus Izimaplasma sp.]|nr:DnaD domain protein [Candidatus Izimaplasma bacterium]
MELERLKKLIQKNIIDFSELVLNNYFKLGLDETDAVILIKLHYLLQKNITFISPKKLADMLSITTQTTQRRLDKLIDKAYVKIMLSKNGSGKETEVFNLDFLIESILREEFKNSGNDSIIPSRTKEKELVEMFEEEFNKPLGVLDIQTITKWLNEDHYTVDQIKDALFEASKQKKLSIKYVDGILLKQEEPTEKYNQTTLIEDLKKIWTE